MIKNSAAVWTIFLTLLTAFVWFLLFSPHFGKKNWDNVVKEVASDAYINVGDLNIVLPLVALLEPSYIYESPSFSLGGRTDRKTRAAAKTKFEELSSKPETAPKVGRIKILIEQYQSFGERTASTKICPLLQREWAQHFCRGEYREVMKKLPEKFYILDEKHLGSFSSHSTVGKERVSDQIKKLTLRPAAVDIACDADGKFCTAGVKTSSETIAIWTVWPSPTLKRSARQMAELQGRAILAFVKYGIGPQPDFEQMAKNISAIPVN